MEFKRNMKKYLQHRSKKVTDDKEAKELIDMYVKLKNDININTIITGIVSITSIILVLNYERFNVVSSKAIGFIPKIKRE